MPQVESISRQVDTLKVDGLIQMLKKEVEAVSNLTRCMDAFTNNHTRLVVIVDGLDSCEQDKLLQVLDMVGFHHHYHHHHKAGFILAHSGNG